MEGKGRGKGKRKERSGKIMGTRGVKKIWWEREQERGMRGERGAAVKRKKAGRREKGEESRD